LLARQPRSPCALLPSPLASRCPSHLVRPDPVPRSTTGARLPCRSLTATDDACGGRLAKDLSPRLAPLCRRARRPNCPKPRPACARALAFARTPPTDDRHHPCLSAGTRPASPSLLDLNPSRLPRPARKPRVSHRTHSKVSCARRGPADRHLAVRPPWRPTRACPPSPPSRRSAAHRQPRPRRLWHALDRRQVRPTRPT
jgi:hypothetical protein